MSEKKIVVLGGAGQAGRSVVRFLIEHTDASVVIADLNLEKVREVLQDLQRTGAGNRVTASYADAAKPAVLAEVFQGATLVIVTATTARYTTNVARACLDAHGDYFDIHDSPEAVEMLNQFAQEAEKAGRLLVTQGGLAPGMVAPMVRLASSSLNPLHGARLGLAMSLRTIERFEQVYDVFDFIVKSKPVSFEEGAWREKSLRDVITMDFGDRFGKRAAFPIHMPELEALPEQLGLEELSLWAGTPNRMVDYLLKKLIIGMYRIRPRLGWPTMARLLFWMSDKMPHEPSGFSNILEAWGKRNGQNCTMRIVVEHEDNYYATAASVIAFLRQYFDGSFIKVRGVRMMGHLIDPERSLQDLRDLGVTVLCEVS
jgi:NAD(P)-dependent dehydrogenase (short-subunit alcohol dehydrogenase family)